MAPQCVQCRSGGTEMSHSVVCWCSGLLRTEVFAVDELGEGCPTALVRLGQAGLGCCV